MMVAYPTIFVKAILIPINRYYIDSGIYLDVGTDISSICIGQLHAYAGHHKTVK